MLNQSLHRTLPAPRTSARIAPALTNTDWCVGDAPNQWDVSFGDRIMASLRRLFTRAHGPVPIKLESPEKAAKRKAA